MQDGLKVKYIVRKADTGEAVEGCFVLRPGKDPAAVTAVRAYAAVTDNGALAADLLRWVGLPPNDPLTLEELRKLEGEPIWTVDLPGGRGRWEICTSGLYDPEAYGRTWLAYRRRPEAAP